MSILTGQGLLDALGQWHLVETARLDGLRHEPGVAGLEPRALAGELIRRGWLTPYQANQVLQDRAPQLLLGHYVLLERLGEGGMGTVFKARHRLMGRVVALKVIRKERLENSDVLRRFQREIRLAAQLNHPNVVLAYDAEEAGGCHFLVMEYVEGTDLGKLLKRHGPLPWPEACDCVRQAALGLQHAHDRGLVHRDVKPSNLFRTRQGVVKVLDLGLARPEAVAATDESGSALTESGQVMGTPDYMAPEQIEHSHAVDGRADVYSLGCTLYHLLAGKPPFAGGSAGKKLARHLTEEPPSLTGLRPEVPAGLAALVRRMMARRPDDRVPTPAEVAAALQAGAGSGEWGMKGLPYPETLVAPEDPFESLSAAALETPVTSPTRRQRRRRERRLLGLLSLAGLVLLPVLGLACWALWPGRHPPAPPTTPRPVEDTRPPLDRLSADAIPAEERLPDSPKELVALLGSHRLRHPGDLGVAAVAASPDGGTVASAANDGSVRLWDAVTGRERAATAGKGSRAMALAFDPRGRRLAAADGREVRLAGAADLKTQLILPNHGDNIFAVAFDATGDRLAVGLQGGGLWVWDLQAVPPREVVLKGHTRAVLGVVFTPDGQTLASVGDDETLRLWRRDGAGWREGPVWPHGAGVKCLAITPDGKSLATGDRRGWVRLWEFGRNGLRAREPFQADARHVHALAFSPDGQALAVARESGGVRLWRDFSGPRPVEVGELPGQQVRTYGMTFLRDGQTLVTGGWDQTVRFWDRDGETWRERWPVRGPTQPLGALAFAADGKTLAAAVGQDRTVWAWSLGPEGFGGPRLLGGTGSHQVGAAFLPDGRLAALSGPGLCLWDTGRDEPGRPLASFPAEDNLCVLAASRAEPSLAAGAQGGKVLVWTLPGPQARTPAVLEGHTKDVYAVAFSPDGRRLASGAGDGTVRLWARAGPRWEGAGVLEGHADAVTALAFLADGKTLVSGGLDGTLRLWDASRGLAQTPALVPDRQAAGVQALAVSPNGRTLAALGRDGRLLWWQTDGWKKQGDLRLPLAVGSMAFARDSRHLAVGNADGSIFLLRLAADGAASPGG
jgi:serine/threonine protein kinase/WD40 repeat protein